MKRRARVAIAIAALGALGSSRLSAEPRQADTALAIQRFDEGEKLMASGNFSAACSKYAESQKLDPQLGTLLHWADCQERIGKLASALAGYKEAAEIAARRNAAGGNEPRERVARARAAALEAKVPKVVLHVTKLDTAGLEIRRDGELLGRSLWGAAMPVDPGSYTFEAQAPGKKIWTKTVDVGERAAKIDLTIPPLEDEGGVSPNGASSITTTVDGAASGADRSQPGAMQRTAGYAVTGLGVIGVGAGVALWLEAFSQRSERDAICTSNLCTPDQAKAIDEFQNGADRNATAGTVALALGGAATVSGIVLLLTAPSSASSGTSVSIVPWTARNAGGASIAGRW